jgi:predicted metal-dependent phosphoesterase TrpH
MSRGDFHLHSTSSDGMRSPTWVMETAAANGVEVLALTDHDNTAGLDEAEVAANRLGLELIPGIEISVRYQSFDVHLLGLAFEVTTEPLQRFLASQRHGRFGRAELMIERLAENGVDIRLERVYEIAGDATVGRPHVARALMEAGYVKSVAEAFDTWIGDNGPAYVSRERLDPKQAIDLIHSAGGVVVAAHPPFIGPTFEAVISELAALGMDGLEVYYKHYEPDLVARLKGIATRNGLAMSGGSDYHGLGNPTDREIGDIPFPDDACDSFLEYLRNNSANVRITVP